MKKMALKDVAKAPLARKEAPPREENPKDRRGMGHYVLTMALGVIGGLVGGLLAGHLWRRL